MAEEVNFKCRICGCTEYTGVYGNSSMVALGGRMYPVAYQCSGCSVVFKDLEKFSTDKTKKQIIEPKSESTLAEKEWLDNLTKKLTKKTATLPIKPAHVELITDKKREKEVKELIKKLNKNKNV